MNASIISLGITGLVGIFLLFGFLWGLIRGLKKSTFRLSWIIVTAIICLFLTHTITNVLVGLDLSFIGLEHNEQPVSTLSEYLQLILTDSMGNNIVNGMPATISLITQIPVMLCSPFVFVILFWLFKIFSMVKTYYQ